MNYYNEYEEPRKKYKLYRSKKFIAILVAAVTLTTGGSIYHVRKVNKEVNSNKDYIVGYPDINLLTNKLTNKVTKNNFVLLDIGSHNTEGTFFQQEKLEYAVQNQIGIGFLVNSNSTTLADVYLDLEYIKNLMATYPTNYPIYLNVDMFLNNENLTYQEAQNLILTFLEKAREQHIFVGVYGQYENMLEEFSNYEKFITDIDEREQLENVDGNFFDSTKDIYYLNPEIEKTILTQSFNQPVWFKEDGYYICKREDTFKSIARKFNLSVADLKKYNHVESLEEGVYLRIPSLVQKNSSVTVSSSPITTGIDVSLWQETISWDEVCVDYAIIQLRDFAKEENDPQFVNNVLGCCQNKIPMGFYVFSRATTISEIKEEAKYVVDQLKGIEVTYPVYLDLETEFWNSTYKGDKYLDNSKDISDRELILDFISVWESELLKAGYTPGIYCNNYIYEKLQNGLGSYLNNFSIWLAGGEYYDQEIDYDEKEKCPEVLGSENIGMKQITTKGLVNGIEGYVDLDYCYDDYESDIIAWDKMTFPKYRRKFMIGGGTSVLFLGGIVLGIHLHKKKKRIRKNKLS